MLENDVDLPPLCETVLDASVRNRPSSMVWGILEPKKDSQLYPFDGLLIGRTLVNAGTESIPVRLLDLTHLSKRIKRGTHIAICSAVLLRVFSLGKPWVIVLV